MLRLQYFYIYSWKLYNKQLLKKMVYKTIHSTLTALINDNGYYRVFYFPLGKKKQRGNMIIFKSNKLLGFKHFRVNILFNG